MQRGSLALLAFGTFIVTAIAACLATTARHRPLPGAGPSKP